MTINPLSANLTSLLANEAIKFDSSKTTGMEQPEGSFANVLTEALGTAAQADVADKVSSLELLIGQSDDLSGLMLDMQKAELSLNLALQLRNKVVDAYNEIMRMSV